MTDRVAPASELPPAGEKYLPVPRARVGFRWALAGVAVAAGVALSWLEFLGDTDWLARAGCLVVVLGIWSGLGAILADRMFQRAYMLRRSMLVTRARMRYRHDPEQRDEAIAAIEKRLEERLERHRGDHQFTVGILEATLLIAGTLLWGFGDLIRYLL